MGLLGGEQPRPQQQVEAARRLELADEQRHGVHRQAVAQRLAIVTQERPDPDATRRSQAAASASSPPTHAPRTTATVGTVSSATRSTAVVPSAGPVRSPRAAARRHLRPGCRSRSCPGGPLRWPTRSWEWIAHPTRTCRCFWARSTGGRCGRTWSRLWPACATWRGWACSQNVDDYLYAATQAAPLLDPALAMTSQRLQGLHAERAAVPRGPCRPRAVRPRGLLGA